ncbi:MAG: hypothetical protein JW847_07565 [Candidatus Omnitrophica bacterium]|nr:hypothetical protein [Candidatus Omnitrophota bacterium]
MNKSFMISFVILSMGLAGCETVHKAGNAVGTAVGATANAVGSVTEGGAEAVQGEVKPEENPYGR